jgi:hypothetical protein
MAKTHEPAAKTGSNRRETPRQDKAPAELEQQPELPDPLNLAAGEGQPPPLDQVAQSLRGDRASRQRRFASIQRRYGNAFAARVAQRANQPGPVIQRHPPGTQVLGGTATVEGGAGGTAGQAAPQPAGGQAPPQPAGGQTPPQPAGGQTPPQPAGGQTTPAANGAGPSQAGPTAQDTPSGGGGAQPATLGMPTLQVAYAQEALQQAFGGVAGRQIITGQIHVVRDQAALYAEYDRICVENNVTNSDTGQVWQTGDLARYNAARNLRTNAFAWEGEIWVDATQTDPTATVHEMLHVNTASAFRGLVGEAINEGMTQRLAVKAVQATGQSVAGSENTYQQEQGVVNAMVAIVGEGTLQNAYFNNPDMLVTGYEAVMGPRSFEVLKRTLNGTAQGFTAALAILQPPSVTQKIAAINTLLDWWVSDADLTIVESIVSTCSDADKAAIATAIQPRITSLTDLGQRTRLRVILGVV